MLHQYHAKGPPQYVVRVDPRDRYRDSITPYILHKSYVEHIFDHLNQETATLTQEFDVNKCGAPDQSANCFRRRKWWSGTSRWTPRRAYATQIHRHRGILLSGSDMICASVGMTETAIFVTATGGGLTMYYRTSDIEDTREQLVYCESHWHLPVCTNTNR
jgi:hypothetical protein